MVKRTATPLVPTTPRHRLLHRPLHRHRSLLPRRAQPQGRRRHAPLHRRQAQPQAGHQKRQQQQQARQRSETRPHGNNRTSAHPLQPAKGVGAAAEERHAEPDRRECGRVWRARARRRGHGPAGWAG